MRINYSSKERTTEQYDGAIRSIKKVRSRQFKLRTSPSKSQGKRIDWGAIFAQLARMLIAIAERLLGSGKRRERRLRELRVMSNGTSFININDFCTKLNVSTNDFVGCANNLKHHVRQKVEPKPDGSIRIIYAPSEKLKVIQRAIKDNVLSPYNYPEYVFGLGGNTLRQHAEIHKGNKQLVKVDIRNFFPSISHTKVYKMWAEDFGFVPEIARLLTKLTTHKGYLQQGFPTSSHIAAIICLPVTTVLKDYSVLNGLNFSQYIDDLNFSGESLTYRDTFKLVVDTAQKNNFSINRRKTKVYSKKLGKIITGVSVVGERTRAPRVVRRRAIDALKAHQANPNDLLSFRRAQGFAGFLKQLNPDDGKKYKNKMGGN